MREGQRFGVWDPSRKPDFRALARLSVFRLPTTHHRQRRTHKKRIESTIAAAVAHCGRTQDATNTIDTTLTVWILPCRRDKIRTWTPSATRSLTSSRTAQGHLRTNAPVCKFSGGTGCALWGLLLKRLSVDIKKMSTFEMPLTRYSVDFQCLPPPVQHCEKKTSLLSAFPFSKSSGTSGCVMKSRIRVSLLHPSYCAGCVCDSFASLTRATC